MIFQHQNLFSVEGQLVPIRNGLQNWKGIWDAYFDTWSSSPPHGMVPEGCLATPEAMWKRVGFVRYAPEYWLLGSLLTDRISLATSSHESHRGSSPSQGMDDSASNPSGMAKAVSINPILDKYDQTSMRQVNDLITDFQKIHID